MPSRSNGISDDFTRVSRTRHHLLYRKAIPGHASAHASCQAENHSQPVTFPTFFIDSKRIFVKMIFPVPAWIEAFPYNTGMRRFGSNRDGGKRKHAGCDLYAPLGSEVIAIADGVVLDAYEFYLKTHAVEVKHGTVNGIVRYGEIKIAPGIAPGASVKEGQVIGYVAKLNSHIHPMLHLELYSGAAVGPLSILNSKGGAFQRRSDLVDPTNLLNRLRGLGNE
jgi:murein DD-endopeptidase MepM/ murein hydrolase activator NlpD